MIAIILIFIIGIFFLFNQTNNATKNEWVKYFEDENHNEGYFVKATDDGGCIALGYSKIQGKEDKDIFIIKTDKSGNTEWTEKYSNRGIDYAKALVKTNDGYVIAGTSNSSKDSFFDFDLLLIKIDFNGSIIWQYTHGGSKLEEVNSIIQNKNGNFIITGSTTSYSQKGNNLWIAEVDINGENMLWNKSYGGNDYDEGRSIIESEDGYIIAGLTKSYSENSEYSDAWLLKTNMLGNEIWNYTFGFDYYDLFNQIIEIDDGFLMVGHSSENKDEAGINKWNGFIVKTDENGLEQRNITIKKDSDVGISSVVKNDKDYVLVGYEKVNDIDNLYILKIDEYGNIIYSETTNQDYKNAGIWIDKTIDSYYYIVGYSDKNNDDVYELCLYKKLIE